MPVALEKNYKRENPEEQNQYVSDPYLHLKDGIRESFLQVNKDIENNVPNAQFSGTTCSIILTRGSQIVSANCGDSRSIIVDKTGFCR